MHEDGCFRLSCGFLFVLPFRTHLFLHPYLFKGVAILVHSLEMNVNLGLKILALLAVLKRKDVPLGKLCWGFSIMTSGKQSIPFC